MCGLAQRYLAPAVADPFAAFEAKWLAALNRQTPAKIAFGSLPQERASPYAMADAFITSLGLKPIGFNWELLDPEAVAGAPRSAQGELHKALTQLSGNPDSGPLSSSDAEDCAADFWELFELAQLNVVSNRYDGLWNPVAGGEIEWGFVAFDQSHIGLLLLMN